MADYPLIFLRQLKELLGVEDSYTGSDTRLILAIDSASRTIENLLGRKLSKNSYTQLLDSKRNYKTGYDLYGHGDQGTFSVYKEVPLYIRNFPIDLHEDFNVYYDPNGVFGADTLLTVNTDYTIDSDTGILIIKKGVGDFKKAIKVEYTAGYENTVDTEGGVVYNPAASPPQEQAIANALPSDLVMAALYQSMLVYDKQYSGNLNVRYKTGEGANNNVGYVNIGAISPEAMAIIMQHKRLRISMV